MGELVLRERCEHGRYEFHGPISETNHGPCPGGRETVLDPEQVMFPLQEGSAITVQDVIDALTKEEK